MANPSSFTVEKTDERRTDRLWSPTTPLAIDALRNIKTAPVRGSPKIISLIRASTGLDKSRPDLGLLDLWVDDGSDGNLDKTLRSLRFSAASSNIYSLFTPERKQAPAEQLVGPADVLSKETDKEDRQDMMSAERQTKGQKLGKLSSHTCGIVHNRKVGEDSEWLETGPIRPPTTTRNRINVQRIFSLVGNDNEAKKNRSRNYHGGAEGKSQEEAQKENASNRRPDEQGSEEGLDASPRKPESRLRKLLKKLCSCSKDCENHDSARQSSPRPVRRTRLHKFVKTATRLFACAFS